VPDFGWGLVLLGAYLLLVILARWIYIARTNAVWTSAQAGAMTKRLSLPLQVECDPSSNGKGPVTRPALKPLVEEIEEHNPKSMRSGIIGWNGSHQIASGYSCMKPNGWHCPLLTMHSWSPGWSGRWDS
jgi:hypothetical protein